MDRRRFLLASLAGAVAMPLGVEAQQVGVYKPEFKLSIVVGPETPWGRAATRFADAVRYRTGGRIHIKPYFDGQLFADEQTTEFALLQQGTADFSIGSTINWSSQVTELNLFALPFMFRGYAAVDAVQVGEPGKRLFKLIEQKGVVPITWGENGFRELTNSKRSVRGPEDLEGLTVRVVGIPVFAEIFRALGANPVNMNFGKAVEAIRLGRLEAQENPVALIIPYRFYVAHRHLSLWHYAIDPLILAVSAKIWRGLRPEDRNIVIDVAGKIMAVQKQESREGLQHDMSVVDTLQRVYGMEVVVPSAVNLQGFRDKTRLVYDKWTQEIGVDLVRRAERIVANAHKYEN